MFVGLLCLLSFRGGYLMALLRLEIVMGGLYLVVAGSAMNIGGGDLLLYYLVVIICRGGFGLTLLVALSRFYGGDMF